MSRLMRSSLALMSSTVATAGLGMLFWTVATWAFDPVEVGISSAGSSAMLTLAALAQLALTTVFARMLPQMTRGVAKFILSGYALMTLASFVLTIGFFAIGLGDDIMTPHPLSELVFGLAVVGTAISIVQDGVLVALGRATWVPVKNTALALARLALLPILAGTDLPHPILVAWAVPTIVAFVVCDIVLFGRIIPRRSSAPDGYHPTRREIVTLIGGQYANSVVNALMLFFPPVLVTTVLGPEENAVFFLPWTITTAIIGLLWNVVVPFISEASADKERIGANVRLMFRFGGLITVGGGIGLLLLGPTLLQLIGGIYAEKSGPELQLLALSLPFAATVSIFHAAELIRMRSSASLLVKVLAAVLFLGTAVPAMNKFGVTGASAAFLLSQVVVGLILIMPLVSWYRTHTTSQLETSIPLPRGAATPRNAGTPHETGALNNAAPDGTAMPGADVPPQGAGSRKGVRERVR